MLKKAARTLFTFGLVGTVIAVQRLRRGKPRPYPTPESLIIDRKLAEDRLIPFEKLPNFRDLGGYQTSDGKSVRRGRLYRAGSFYEVTDADMAKLAELNIKLVCDLRTDTETSEQPDRVPEGVTLKHLPVFQQGESYVRLRTFIFDRHRLDEVMIESYTDFMLSQKATVFGEVIRLLADEANLPAVFHCTAGKDRTGLLAMLILMVLGVSDETIIADYSLSNLFYENVLSQIEKQRTRLQAVRLTPQDISPLLVSHPDYLRAAIGFIRQRYGSAEAYLTQAAGVAPSTLQKLRELMLE
ncbi:MAG: tyrosine-protein phosphatase [Anaerolineae bacterium]